MPTCNGIFILYNRVQTGIVIDFRHLAPGGFVSEITYLSSFSEWRRINTFVLCVEFSMGIKSSRRRKELSQNNKLPHVVAGPEWERQQFGHRHNPEYSLVVFCYCETSKQGFKAPDAHALLRKVHIVCAGWCVAIVVQLQKLSPRTGTSEYMWYAIRFRCNNVRYITVNINFVSALCAKMFEQVARKVAAYCCDSCRPVSYNCGIQFISAASSFWVSGAENLLLMLYTTYCIVSTQHASARAQCIRDLTHGYVVKWLCAFVVFCRWRRFVHIRMHMLCLRARVAVGGRVCNIEMWGRQGTNGQCSNRIWVRVPA